MGILRDSKLLLMTLLIAIVGILFLAYQNADLFNTGTEDKDNRGDVVDKTSVLKTTKPPPQTPSEKQDSPKSLEPALYQVAAGDTLSGIAEHFGIDVETILGANDLPNPHRLNVGRELVILPVKGVLHQIKPGETLAAVALRYGVEVESILEANSNLDPLGLQPGQKIIVPGAKPVSTVRATTTVTTTSRGGAARKFTLPVQGRLTARFGQRTHPITGNRDFHEGWDLASPEGTPIKAAAAGRVTFAGWDGGYGLLVRIDHGNGMNTLYAHASSILVSVGEQVSPGTDIAKVGSTGQSTGPHVHLEVRVDGRPVDPWQYF